MAIPIPTIDDFNDTTVMRTIRKVVAYLKDPIVDTINELEETVSGYDDVISEVERYNERISTLETEMDAVETKNAEQDSAISENATAIQSEATARENNDITALNITYNSGNLQAIMSRLAGSIEGSVDLPFIKTAELIPTTTERAFKIQFTFWDDSQYDTNEFVIPEGSGSGTDVTVSAVTVNDGTADNSFQVAIQLSDGSSISSNDYVISSSGEGGTTVTAVSGSVSGNTLTLNITNSDSTSVNGTINNLVTSVSGSVSDNDAIVSVNGVSGSISGLIQSVVNSITGNNLVTTVNGVGSTAVTLPSGGSEEWEQVTDANWPSDWKLGDEILIYGGTVITGSYSSWTGGTASANVTILNDRTSYFKVEINQSSIDLKMGNVLQVTGLAYDVDNTTGPLSVIRMAVAPASTFNNNSSSDVLMQIECFNITASARTSTITEITRGDLFTRFTNGIYRKKSNLP